jgi:hypothetical protein
MKGSCFVIPIRRRACFLVAVLATWAGAALLTGCGNADSVTKLDAKRLRAAFQKRFDVPRPPQSLK